jgi:kinesin family member 17
MNRPGSVPTASSGSTNNNRSNGGKAPRTPRSSRTPRKTRGLSRSPSSKNAKSERIHVCVRVRPLNEVELKGQCIRIVNPRPFRNEIVLNKPWNTLTNRDTLTREAARKLQLQQRTRNNVDDADVGSFVRGNHSIATTVSDDRPDSARSTGDAPLVFGQTAQNGAAESHNVAGEVEDDNSRRFTYDAVFGEHSTQEQLFEQAALPMVLSVLEGINATIFAYGQTGSGKTYTMEGVSRPPELWGVIPRAIREVFDRVSQLRTIQNAKSYTIYVSHTEIYNEKVRDLLSDTPRTPLQLVEDTKKGGVIVKSLSRHRVTDYQAALRLLKRGSTNRVLGATEMNQDSSRSHSIFTVTLSTTETIRPDAVSGASSAEQQNSSGSGSGSQTNSIKSASVVSESDLRLVDLAGSERHSKSKASGRRLIEATNINQSLTTLCRVIKALVSNSAHVPFRDSKLTRLLQTSLGGNARTLMIATVSPADSNYDETLSTLRYGHRTKSIKNKPRVNDDPKVALLKAYREEIETLRSRLKESQVTLDLNSRPLSAPSSENGALSARSLVTPAGFGADAAVTSATSSPAVRSRRLNARHSRNSSNASSRDNMAHHASESDDDGPLFEESAGEIDESGRRHFILSDFHEDEQHRVFPQVELVVAPKKDHHQHSRTRRASFDTGYIANTSTMKRLRQRARLSRDDNFPELQRVRSGTGTLHPSEMSPRELQNGQQQADSYSVDYTPRQRESSGPRRGSVPGSGAPSALIQVDNVAQHVHRVGAADRKHASDNSGHLGKTRHASRRNSNESHLSMEDISDVNDPGLKRLHNRVPNMRPYHPQAIRESLSPLLENIRGRVGAPGSENGSSQGEPNGVASSGYREVSYSESSHRRAAIPLRLGQRRRGPNGRKERRRRAMMSEYSLSYQNSEWGGQSVSEVPGAANDQVFPPNADHGNVISGPGSCMERYCSPLVWIDGSMPDSHAMLEDRGDRVLDMLNSLLRGAGQVVFMNNPVCGILIMIALIINDSWQAACGSIALFAGTLTAVIFGFESAPRRSGLYGFNALLVGLSIGIFQPEHPRAFIWAALFGAASTIITVALANVLVGLLRVSALTLPFNISASIMLLAALQSSHMPLNSGAFSPSRALFDSNPAVGDYDALDSLSVGDTVWGVIVGVGQVFFVDDRTASVLIVCGIFLASRIACAMAIMGSLVGTLTAIGLGTDPQSIYNGLWSYNACLGAIAVGGVFYMFSAHSVLLAAANAVGCTLIHAALSSMLAPLGLPVFTTPFCLSTIGFVLLQKSLSRVNAVPIEVVATPEENLFFAHEHGLHGNIPPSEMEIAKLASPGSIVEHSMSYKADGATGGTNRGNHHTVTINADASRNRHRSAFRRPSVDLSKKHPLSRVVEQTDSFVNSVSQSEPYGP